jgi:hypothetical protein
VKKQKERERERGKEGRQSKVRFIRERELDLSSISMIPSLNSIVRTMHFGATTFLFDIQQYFSILELLRYSCKYLEQSPALAPDSVRCCERFSITVKQSGKCRGKQRSSPSSEYHRTRGNPRWIRFLREPRDAYTGKYRRVCIPVTCFYSPSRGSHSVHAWLQTDDGRRETAVCCHSTCRKELCELGRFGDTSQITQLVVAPLLQRARFLSLSLPSSRALVPRLEGARDRGSPSLSLSLSLARTSGSSPRPRCQVRRREFPVKRK